MKIYEIELEGISPLLMNRPSQLDIGDKSKTAKRETQTPEEIAVAIAAELVAARSQTEITGLRSTPKNQ